MLTMDGIFCWMCSSLVLIICARSVDAACDSIVLTASNPTANLIYVGGDPCPSCQWTISSPPGTTLNATFRDLRVPQDDTLTLTVPSDEITDPIIAVSGISSTIEPVLLSLSQAIVSFYKCGTASPNTNVDIYFSFSGQLQNETLVSSSGGTFNLSDSVPEITLQSPDMSSLANIDAELHWYIDVGSSHGWTKLEALTMDPGKDADLYVFDSYSGFGNWVSVTDTAPSATWYLYGNQIQIAHYIEGTDQPGTGITIRISVIDPLRWNGQGIIMPTCSLKVTLEDMQDILFVTPYYNQSLLNIIYSCRMEFRSRESRHPRVEYLGFDFPGEITVYSIEGSTLVNLADATDIYIDTTLGSPLVSVSPNDELYVDLVKRNYGFDGRGIMLRGDTIVPVWQDLEPVNSFGVSAQLNDSSNTMAFTTMGYPSFPTTTINTWWLIDNDASNAGIKLMFVDFDIGSAILFVHVAETTPSLLEHSGSTLPDDVFVDTLQMTVLVRSDGQGSGRGAHFNVTLITLINECDAAPCANEGTCVDEPESFHCECPSQYDGNLCQDYVPTTQATTTPATTRATTTPATTRATTTLSKTSQPTTTADVKTDHATTRAETTAITPSRPPYTAVPLPTTVVALAPPEAKKDNNTILIVALSVSLTIAFSLIAFLVCVVVYRSGKSRPNSPVVQPMPPHNNYHDGSHDNTSFLDHEYADPRENVTRNPGLPPPAIPIDPPPHYDDIDRPSVIEGPYAEPHYLNPNGRDSGVILNQIPVLPTPPSQCGRATRTPTYIDITEVQPLPISEQDRCTEILRNGDYMHLIPQPNYDTKITPYVKK